MWVLISLVVGLVAVVVAAIAVLVARRRSAAGHEASEMTRDQWITLGVIFTGTGVVMTATLGPYMVWMIALGVIYMALGARMKRTPPK